MPIKSGGGISNALPLKPIVATPIATTPVDELHQVRRPVVTPVPTVEARPRNLEAGEIHPGLSDDRWDKLRHRAGAARAGLPQPINTDQAFFGPINLAGRELV
jgi:hypothetical protein